MIQTLIDFKHHAFSYDLFSHAHYHVLLRSQEDADAREDKMVFVHCFVAYMHMCFKKPL